MYYIVMHTNLSSSYQTKRWADYEDDYLLPIIPWAPYIKQISLKYQPNEWTIVKSKKKR